MTVYHGGAAAVSNPDLSHSRKVFDTLEAFFDGFATKAQTIDRLRMETPNLQMCFRTAAALQTLKFVGSEQI